MLDLAVGCPALNTFRTKMMIFLRVLSFILLSRIIGAISHDDDLDG